jgi:hypothetical protein
MDGTICIVCWPDGDVLSSAADFSRCSAAGIDDEATQRRIAGGRAMAAAVKDTCSPAMAAAILKRHRSEWELERLLTEGGFRVVYRAVEGPDSSEGTA